MHLSVTMLVRSTILQSNDYIIITAIQIKENPKHVLLHTKAFHQPIQEHGIEIMIEIVGPVKRMTGQAP